MSTPSRSSSASSMSPAGSVPIAPALRTSAPSLASTSAVPPAEPAAVIRISSTSWPPWPSGIASTGRTSTSSTCTPSAIAFIRSASFVCPYPRASDRVDDRLPLVLVERARRADRRGAPVDACRPTRAARQVGAPRRRRRRSVSAPWLAISAARPALERVEHGLGELRRAERLVAARRGTGPPSSSIS